MILPGGPLKVFVATKPVDFRKGIDGLAALAQEQLRLDPFAGTVLVFRTKRADRVKILVWDGSGKVLISKRLDDGKFAWPKVARRRDAAERRPALGALRGPRLAAGARPTGPAASLRGIAATL